jgi:hypothetical protein
VVSPPTIVPLRKTIGPIDDTPCVHRGPARPDLAAASPNTIATASAMENVASVARKTVLRLRKGDPDVKRPPREVDTAETI